jgi:membrane protease subunit HflC
VRLDKRILFFRPAPSEFLTIDKKNLSVDSLVTWRIADPERFLAALATPAAAEQRLSDVVLAQIGAVMGQHPASVLISTDLAKRNYQAVASEVLRRTVDFARTAYGIDVVSVDVRRLYPPELNREHVFERMKAERAKIAKENRSAGEVEAKRIIAEADHEKIRIDSDAAGQAERIKAEADAEASRTYAAAFGQDPRFYQFLRTLRAYDKLLDDKTTIFLPADTDALRMLHFDKQPGQVGPSPPAPGEFSTGADLLQNKKREEEVR